MPRVAPRVPEATDLLCEKCGYVLNGLPENGRCPECGTPIEQSLGQQRIGPTAGFLRTTGQIIFHPGRFYRTLNVRGSVAAARRFARPHWLIASGLFALAASAHAYWYATLLSWPRANPGLFAGLAAALTIGTYFVMDGITSLAARLTNWEATYRGYRLPLDTVLRGMYYHAAHYFPVALAAAITVVGHEILYKLRIVTENSADRYLYFLCGQVIVSAGYLFNAYWIGMRNMMYANR